MIFKILSIRISKIIFNWRKNILYSWGNLNYKKLNLNKNIALGEPGLLLSKFFKPLTNKEYNFYIIIHFTYFEWFEQNYYEKFYILEWICLSFYFLIIFLYLCFLKLDEKIFQIFDIYYKIPFFLYLLFHNLNLLMIFLLLF